jgi:hypothetical protein
MTISGKQLYEEQHITLQGSENGKPGTNKVKAGTASELQTLLGCLDKVIH